MPRSKGDDKRAVQIRAHLENIMAVLVRMKHTQRLTTLRVRQARDRSGLVELLDPALDELVAAGAAVDAMSREIATTLDVLVDGGLRG